MIDGLNFTELEVNPSLVTTREDLGTFLGFSNPRSEHVFVQTSSNADSADSKGKRLEAATLGSCSLAAVVSAESLCSNCQQIYLEKKGRAVFVLVPRAGRPGM